MPKKILNYITANKMYEIRQWEKMNLPHYGSDAGHTLFFELAKIDDKKIQNLKEFYLSMPYAESTMRLLFRHLENDGWLKMERESKDQRIRIFILSEKFYSKKKEWLYNASQILSRSD